MISEENNVIPGLTGNPIHKEMKKIYILPIAILITASACSRMDEL
jgi:hypothetical protein